MKSSNLFTEFFHSEKAGGVILIFCTIISLFLANYWLQDTYVNFWHIKLGTLSIEHWINDGLMTIFFLLIGLELEREIYAGELSDVKKASLPIIAAFGGMIIPAGIYLLFNFVTPAQSGIGIPMATDIAFAIGILSLLGNRVPLSLKVFLTALAVIDDLGAVIVIAIFYTNDLSLINLFLALGVWVVMLALNRFKVHILLPYLIGGIVMWYFMLHSGVHATITGVLLAFAIPFGDGSEKSISIKLQHFLHKPVAFLILPVFALANTAIQVGGDWAANLTESYSLGIITGLVVGKPLGIMLFSLAAAMIGISSLPSDLKWKHIFGAGILGGIGFTMSIFIALIAFDSMEIINGSKIAILLASTTAGIIGFLWLKYVLKDSAPVI